MNDGLSLSQVILLEQIATGNGFDLVLPRQGAWLAFGSSRFNEKLWLTATQDGHLVAAVRCHGRGANAMSVQAFAEAGEPSPVPLPEGSNGARAVTTVAALRALVRLALRLHRAPASEPDSSPARPSGEPGSLSLVPEPIALKRLRARLARKLSPTTQPADDLSVPARPPDGHLPSAIERTAGERVAFDIGQKSAAKLEWGPSEPLERGPEGPALPEPAPASSTGPPRPRPQPDQRSAAKSDSALDSSRAVAESREPGHADEAFSSHTVVLRYPTPIALAYQRFCATKEAVPRAHALFRAVEAIGRYLTAVTVSDLARHLLEGSATPVFDGPEFELLRRKTNMQLGLWFAAARAAARALKDDPARFLRDLEGLEAVCREDGPLGRLVTARNRVAHPEAALILTEDQAGDVLKDGRPLLEAALQRLRFLCDTPLTLFAARTGVPGRWAVLPCMGAQLRGEDEAHKLDSPVALRDLVPCLLDAERRRALYLWPLLTSRRSPHTQRPTLYTFEHVEGDKGAFLTRARAAAIDTGETWSQQHRDPAASHAWLFERLRSDGLVVELPPALVPELARGVALDRGDRRIGWRLGPYRLDALVGAGGFGQVYAATAEDGRRAAVKVLDDGAVGAHLPRFRQELARARGCTHPGIVRVFEDGSPLVEGREVFWYAMELAACDLSARLAAWSHREPPAEADDDAPSAGGPGPTRPWDDPTARAERGRVFLAVADALASLHAQGLVHRDVKPSNVLFTDEGEVRLADLGLVKKLDPGEETLLHGPRTSTGAVLGTAGYMAPEQRAGQDVGKPADVYALGVLLAVLATGELRPPEPPALGPGTKQRPELASWRPLRALPQSLRGLILACTEVDPARRPPDAAAVAARFLAALGAGPTPRPERFEVRLAVRRRSRGRALTLTVDAPDDRFQGLLDEIYQALRQAGEDVGSLEYGKTWALRDEQTRELLPHERQFFGSEVEDDSRTLAQVGITPGAELEVVDPRRLTPAERRRVRPFESPPGGGE